MFRKSVTALSMAGALAAASAATPVLAQDGYYSHYSESYREDGGGYSRTESYRRGYDGYKGGNAGGGYYRDGYRGGRNIDYDSRGYADRGYVDHNYDRGYRDGPPPPRRYAARCSSSGTTGTIIGAALGGLLGREVGRGGRWNQPSTTGLILGAGAGALAGRAIERDGC